MSKDGLIPLCHGRQKSGVHMQKCPEVLSFSLSANHVSLHWRLTPRGKLESKTPAEWM
ncbi:MAG: hypothetical protein WA113_10115 [Desulfitobacteriaceae bacterium]